MGQMTEMNALRHFVARGKKALHSGNTDMMQKIENQVQFYFPLDIKCNHCHLEDFGWCLLDDCNVNPDEETKMCFAHLIYELELKLYPHKLPEDLKNEKEYKEYFGETKMPVEEEPLVKPKNTSFYSPCDNCKMHCCKDCIITSLKAELHKK